MNKNALPYVMLVTLLMSVLTGNMHNTLAVSFSAFHMGLLIWSGRQEKKGRHKRATALSAVAVLSLLLSIICFISYITSDNVTAGVVGLNVLGVSLLLAPYIGIKFKFKR